MSTPTIHGTVEPGFEPVVDAFAKNFTDRGDTGAACTVYLHGSPVVNVHAGEYQQGPWTADTRSVLFSVSKGITTVCLLMAVETGHLALDEQVVTYWPEFAENGKGTLTVRQMLAHRAGLIAPVEPLTLQDLQSWFPVTEALARQHPLWEPGSAHSYHALTFGWLAGEVLRRTTGLRPAAWLRQHINAPLGLGLSFGTDPLTDLNFALQGEILPSAPESTVEAPDPGMQARVMGMNGAMNGTNLFATANTPDLLGYESPAANLVGTAHDIARLYAATISEVDGVRLLKPDTVRDARLPQSTGAPFFGPDAGHRWGTGFMLDSSARSMAGTGSFGHDGAGGQLGFAHPESGAALGYATIRPGGNPDDRAEAICRALRAVL
jgi:CubicO group peptidase (beta-lactamase class C family)